MFYFILWVLFLFAVILAVPVVSFMEKRAARGPVVDENVAEDGQAEEKEFGENEGFTDDAMAPQDAEFASAEPMEGEEVLAVDEGFEELK
ncbi:hypothetical protein CA13_13380 [Planctomycetes bacterium CA13]|uniref:Uncharacterized protein n=2 Tax=Novipirellula herctigrandis TaxID=2527986 RepID=A0A5C5YZ85_9BACT|nr:hypothetical protein CA13_13380 [Planctomycetes bacterium CA13]